MVRKTAKHFPRGCHLGTEKPAQCGVFPVSDLEVAFSDVAFSVVVLFMLNLFFPSLASATISITKIDSPYAVSLHFDSEKLAVADQLIVVSSFDHGTAGFLRVESIDDSRSMARAIIISHEKNGLVLVGDEAIRVDFTHPDPRLRGRADLLTNERDIPIKYKDLSYLGQAMPETAQTLAAGENGINIITNFFYGVTDNLTISSLIILDVVGLPEFSIKYKLFDFGDVKAALDAHGIYASTQGTWEQAYTAALDVKSNSKLISHTAITAVFNDIESSTQSAQFKPRSGSFVQSGYEYILDNWNRVIAVPAYDLDRKTLVSVAEPKSFFDYLSEAMQPNEKWVADL
jgi:hypothetical protein